jgi:hypothetical protein
MYKVIHYISLLMIGAFSHSLLTRQAVLPATRTRFAVPQRAEA